jgi:hypothetical protein
LRLRPDLGPTNMELGRAVDAIGTIHPGQHSS